MTDSWEPSGQPLPPIYASSRGRAQWVIGLMVAIVMLDILSAVSTSLQVGLFERAMAGAAISEAQAAANDDRQAIIGLFMVALWIGSCIAFLLWAHRAHRNLSSLGVDDLRFKPKHAVIYFFIPVLNLFKPLQVMKEIWYGSHPATGRLKTGRPSMAVVGWWWGLFLFTNWIGWRSSVALWRGETLSELKAASVMSVVADLVDIPAALSAIALVHLVTRWQDEKHAALVAGIGIG